MSRDQPELPLLRDVVPLVIGWWAGSGVFVIEREGKGLWETWAVTGNQLI